MFEICTNLSDSITGLFEGSTVVFCVTGTDSVVTDCCRFGD